MGGDFFMAYVFEFVIFENFLGNHCFSENDVSLSGNEIPMKERNLDPKADLTFKKVRKL